MKRQKKKKKKKKKKKNLQSKGMEDSPLKELNEMEVSKLYDRIKNNGYKDAQ